MPTDPVCLHIYASGHRSRVCARRRPPIPLLRLVSVAFGGTVCRCRRSRRRIRHVRYVRSDFAYDDDDEIVF